MLVLSRRVGERIHIQPPGYPEIVLEVKEICHGRVKLGIEASQEVQIIREELLPDWEPKPR